MNQFLVVVYKEYVRDVQIALSSSSEYSGEEWADYNDCEVVIGTFVAENESQAISFGSQNSDIPENLLRAYQLK